MKNENSILEPSQIAQIDTADTDKIVENIIQRVHSYSPSANTDMIYVAYRLLSGRIKTSSGRAALRISSIRCRFAYIASQLSLDATAIAACLLHDVVEDTQYHYEDIEALFGKSVAELVDGVTKLRKIKYNTREEQQVENLRKMFLAMAKDIRVVIIKLIDRLHNMRTLNFMPRKKQLLISQGNS